MLESLEEKKCDLTQMDPLQRRLKGIVEGKRILLVFDDIWKHRNLNMEAWEALCRPLLGVSTGSKIIVTTRDRNILDGVIMPARVHPLPYLSNDDCFMLFSQYAFEGRDSDIDHNLLDIGKKISNKCRGLPLAAKTLGSLLRGQDDVEKWNDILDNSGIWNSGYQNPVMPVLWLSYQSLPTNLKECFRYCSVFPKDYQFHRDQLINMWIAHGYITQTGEKDLEDIGEEYIKDLVSRSLLDKFEDYEIFIMHHLIHDLARDVSKGEWWRVEYDVFYGNQEDNVHHLSLISTINYPQENVQWSPQIQSLLIFNSSLIFDDIKHLCSRMKHLRVVDMSYSGILNLPESISDLKHLRYLSLQGNQISELPGTVGSLSFLETLNLNNTRMKVLPDSICFLKHLRYLGLQGTCIEYLPESLGMLDQLHTLDVELCKIDSLPDSILNLPSLRRLICNDDIVFSLPFEKLNNLHGRSVIGKEFTDLVNVDEAKKASSYSKEHLNVLSLVWNDNRSPMAYYLHGEVLESLGGLPNLRQLYMQGFAGSSLPSWLTDPHYLPWLVRIDLIRCKNLTSLPPLENFPKLRHVHIESAERLKGLGSQLTGDRAQTNEKPSALRTLAIVDCPNVSSFSVDGCNALQVLKIIICPRLKLSHLVRLRFLQHLSIVSSFEDIPAEFSSGRFPRLERLELKDLPNWRSWGGPKQGECPRLQKLSVAGCKSLENFSISCLHSLKQIFVTNCPNLQALSDRELNIPDCRNVSSFSEVGFSARRILKINRCPSLQLSRLGGLAYLQHLSIKGSNQDIPAYFSFRGFQWLERLELENLPNWRSWEGPKEDECPRLQELSVVDCHSLSHFSISFLQSLKDICVNNCSSLEISISDVIKLLNTERYCVKNILGTKIISHGHNELEQSQGMPYSPRAAFISPERLSLTSNRCPDLTCFPLYLLENLEELRNIKCSGPAAFIKVQWQPSTLRVLEIDRFRDSAFSAPLDYYPKIGNNVKLFLPLFRLLPQQRQNLEDSPELCFSDEENLPLTLPVLCIVGCPKLEMWCQRNIQRLKNIRILNKEESQVDTTPSSILFTEVEDYDSQEYSRAHDNNGFSDFSSSWESSAVSSGLPEPGRMRNRETGGTPGGPVGAGLRQPPVEGPAQQLPYPTEPGASGGSVGTSKKTKGTRRNWGSIWWTCRGW